MNFIRTSAVIYLVTLLLTAFPARADNKGADENVIAVIDMRAVAQVVGYDGIQILNANDEIKKVLRDLREQKREIQKQLIQAKDKISLDKVQETMNFLEQKIRSVRASIPRTENLDINAVVEKFVENKYRGRYMLIVGRHESYRSIFLPRPGARVENISEMVAKDLQAELQ